MLPLVHPFYPFMWFLAAPVLIHLINMLRHQRIEWAAMEFLLLSQKKHRTWVILKQLILLLLRMAAIALVVLALAQPLLPDRWGGFLGAQPTHHVVLLDDSFSMSENLGSTTAFDQAKSAIQRLCDSVVRSVEPQTFTLLRLSRCGGRYGGTRPDFQKEPIKSDFAKRLGNALESMDISQTAAEPLPAFEVIQQLLGENTDEHRIVYLLSDFRTRQWDKPDELKKRLAQLDENHVDIRLIDCVDDPGRPNLAIASLEPEEDIRAADVQWRMRVTVRNYGPAAIGNVPVYWSADGKPGGTVTIRSIPAGDWAQEEFYVNFAVAGEHLIEAHLNADAVGADNHRYAVVDLPVTTPVLLVDSDPNRRNAKRLADALTARKGIQPEIESPDYLSAPKRPLEDFAMICVTNFAKIERAGVEALEKYVDKGGGVFFATGQLTRGEYVTQDLYRNGKGLFPLPLTAPQELVVDPLDVTPDVQSEDHDVFRNMEHRVENLSKIYVDHYYAVSPDWNAKRDPSVRVIMRLRRTSASASGAPLLVEKDFGHGRVLAFLSTTSSKWNNWSSAEPSFVAFVLNMVPYLSHRFGAGDTLLVGEPKALTFAAPAFEPAVHFSGPGGEASAAALNAQPAANNRQTVTYAKTETAGFYKALLTAVSHKTETRNFAVNVDPAEGDLRALTRADMAPRLAPLPYKFEYASEYNMQFDETQGRNLGDSLLMLLVLVLIVEQFFAWSCSYHLSTSMTNPWKPGTGHHVPMVGGQSGQVENLSSKQVENLSYTDVKGGPA